MTLRQQARYLDRAQEFYTAVLGLEVGLLVDVIFLHA